MRNSMIKCRGCRKMIWFWQDYYRFRPTCGNKNTISDIWHRVCNPNITGVFDKK
jgi:NADH pyrophosphatase NudC (nudix superfamily)